MQNQQLQNKITGEQKPKSFPVSRQARNSNLRDRNTVQSDYRINNSMRAASNPRTAKRSLISDFIKKKPAMPNLDVPSHEYSGSH